MTAHTPDNAFGGPMRVAVNLATGLMARGHEVDIACVALGFGAPLPTYIDGVPSRVFKGRRVAPIPGWAGLSSVRLIQWARRSVRDYDLVHAHLARDLVTLPVARLAQARGVPTVLQTHGMIDPSERRTAWILDRVATRRTLRSAEAVLYLTNHERRALNEVARIDSDRLIRLVNGVPPQEPVAPARGRPTVLFLARLEPRKRPEDVVRVAALLRDQGVDADFVIAGPDQGSLDDTLGLIARLKLEDRVSYVGGVDHERALDLMGKATVYMLPSVNEPFPVSVLEAMSLGRPVVITTSNGLAQDVRQSGAGRVVEPDVTALARAVVDLLDPTVHAIASVAALEAVQTRFNMDGIVDQVEALYRDLVGAKASSR